MSVGCGMLPRMLQHALSYGMPPRPPMTLEEWADMEEDEPGELVDGQLVEDEMPEPDHEVIVSWLIEALRRWVIARGGFVFGSELKIAVSPRRGRKPDVSVYLPGGPFPRRHGLVRVPPAIMVEVISAAPRDARRDRIEKADDYSAFGVRYYWLIDPRARILEIFALNAERQYTRVTAAAEGTIEVPGCPEMKLDLDAMWAEVDRLEPGEEPSYDEG